MRLKWPTVVFQSTVPLRPSCPPALRQPHQHPTRSFASLLRIAFDIYFSHSTVSKYGLAPCKVHFPYTTHYFQLLYGIALMQQTYGRMADSTAVFSSASARRLWFSQAVASIESVPYWVIIRDGRGALTHVAIRGNLLDEWVFYELE